MPSYRGDEIIEEWKEAFEASIFQQETFVHPALSVVLSAKIRNYKIWFLGNYIDCRQHHFWFAPPGSAKGRSYDMIARLAKLCHLNMQPLTKPTDASLVGGIDENDQPIYGLLHRNSQVDIIGMEEANVLLKGDDYTRNAKTFMQQAMNPIGSYQNIIVKKLQRGPPIITESQVTFLFMTYPLKQFYSSMYHDGFIQRQVAITSFPDPELTDKVVEDIIDGLGDRTKTQPQLNTVARSLNDIIKELDQGRKADDKCFEFSKDSKKALNKLNQRMIRASESLSLYERELLYNFRIRWFLNGIKYCAHHRALFAETTIQPADVAFAKEIMMPQWLKLIRLIENSQTRDAFTMDDAIYKMLPSFKREYTKIVNEEKEMWVSRPVLIKSVMDSTKKSRSTVNDALKKIEMNIEMMTIRQIKQRIKTKRDVIFIRSDAKRPPRICLSSDYIKTTEGKT